MPRKNIITLCVLFVVVLLISPSLQQDADTKENEPASEKDLFDFLDDDERALLDGISDNDISQIDRTITQVKALLESGKLDSESQEYLEEQLQELYSVIGEHQDVLGNVDSILGRDKKSATETKQEVSTMRAGLEDL